MKPRFLVKGPASSCFDGLIRPQTPATLAVDPDGRVVHWSSAAAELFGPAAGEAIGRPIVELVRDDQHEQIKTALAEAAAGRRSKGVLAVQCCDTSTCDIELSWDPMDGGGLVAIIANPTMELGTAGDTGRARLALLSEASIRIGSTLDIRRTGAEVMEVAVPRLADAAGVLVRERLIAEDEYPGRDGDGETVVRRIAAGDAGGPGTARWRAEFALDELAVYPATSPYARCMELGQAVTFGGGLAVPLRARGTVLGCVVLVRGDGRPAFDNQDVTLAEELAARAAVCIDNARLYDRERRTALTLQSSLLPTGLREPLGLEIAHRYLPASDLTGVGGDWYDVIPLPGGRVALVVGDVMGHGTGAAATMGQLRTAVRTLAGLDLPPEDVLQRLDAMIEGMGGMQNATCVYATYDPVGQQCAVARAGHIPPLILRPDGSTEVLDCPPGLPLGIGGEPFETRRVRLGDDCTLVLLTDGLVESRDRDIDAGIRVLRRTLAGPRRGLEQICDVAIEALRPNHDRDDIALLLARVRPLSADRIAAVTLPPEPRSAGRARRFARETLAEWGLDGLAYTAELAIGELAANAVRHGAGPIEVRLMRGAVLVCEVADSSSARPEPRCPDTLAEGGRGLQMVRALAARWGTRTLPHGKIVWCEMPITPPDVL
ncbi:SpoIIE family protein phosphatase [Actinomadura sp. 9N407]|uniref:SpoIIE family protein phosphatase n=1 Tax=Actinomadura sp. 9N407 TaxID=3375154 RepID=UPI0037973111